jgi:hypothetical protein
VNNLEKRKFLTLSELELQPVASRYSDCAIPAALIWDFILHFFFQIYEDNSDCTATRLWTVTLRDRDSIPNRGKVFFFSP